MARPREHDEETRAALMASAAALLREEGPAALSVRRVATDVGTTTRAIYSLFGSKEELVRALLREGFTGLDTELATVEVTDDPRRDVSELGLAYRRSALARPDLYFLMFGQTLDFEPDVDDIALADGTLDRLRQAIARGVQAGRFRGDAEALTLQMWGLVHGLASIELRGACEGRDAEALFGGALDAMLDGISARS